MTLSTSRWFREGIESPGRSFDILRGRISADTVGSRSRHLVCVKAHIASYLRQQKALHDEGRVLLSPTGLVYPGCFFE